MERCIAAEEFSGFAIGTMGKAIMSIHPSSH